MIIFPRWAALVFGVIVCSAKAADAPVIPVRADAYRQWDRWPVKRIGARAYMRSTYDRTGGNRSADASHYLYQLADDNNVALDVEGNGILYFACYNHCMEARGGMSSMGMKQSCRKRVPPIRCIPRRIQSFSPRNYSQVR